MQLPRVSSRIAVLASALLLLAGTCFAAQDEGVYCFSPEDFSGEQGIVLTALPADSAGSLRYGSRTIRAGDVLTRQVLSELRFCPGEAADEQISIRYLPIDDTGAGSELTLTLQVFGKKADLPPTAEDAELETYKNIANTGTLRAADPEGSELTYTIVTEPRRGSVTIAPDGSFTYTPNKNKVGKDSFRYTVTDKAGNSSEPATVTVRIQKPDDKTTFTDMLGQPGEYYAMWIKDQGLLSGERVAGSLCFGPDKTVTRGEFVVLVMQLFDLSQSESALTTTFADTAQIPTWMHPYLTGAVSAGLISGTQTEDGMVFRADSAITEAEAAVILRNLLQLPSAEVNVSDPAAEVWALQAVAALEQIGIHTLSASAQPLDRLRCAELLCSAYHMADAGRYGLLAWAVQE